MAERPGWIRLSIHPTMCTEEIIFACNSVKEVVENHKEWGKDYDYIEKLNDYVHKSKPNTKEILVERLFL